MLGNRVSRLFPTVFRPRPFIGLSKATSTRLRLVHNTAANDLNITDAEKLLHSADADINNNNRITFDDDDKTNNQPKERSINKFWKTVSIAKVSDNNTVVYSIRLDERPLKTSFGGVLTVSSLTLAKLIAQEWDADTPSLKLHALPITSLVSRSHDIASKLVDRSDILNSLSKYLATDTICFYQDYPNRLVELQRTHWDPIIKWAQSKFDVNINVSYSIFAPRQSEETVERLVSATRNFDDLKLAAFEKCVMNTKSFLIALALVERETGVEEAANAARVETLAQTGAWGSIEDAHEIESAELVRQLGSAVCVLFK